jgi:hypothetical protein
MRSGACMLDTYMRIAPTHTLLDRILSQATWAALRSDAAIMLYQGPRSSAQGLCEPASLNNGGNPLKTGAGAVS